MAAKLHFDDHSLRIESEGNDPATLEWPSVLEVFAYKDDAFNYDIINIGFRINDQGDYVRVDEEAEGYKSLLKMLPKIFEGIREDWFSDVVFPAFETCLTCLWGEEKIEEIWANS